MGALQGKCCETERNQEADRKADAEEKSMVTVDVQDVCGDEHAKGEADFQAKQNAQAEIEQVQNVDEQVESKNGVREEDPTPETDKQPVEPITDSTCVLAASASDTCEQVKKQGEAEEAKQEAIDQAEEATTQLAEEDAKRQSEEESQQAHDVKEQVEATTTDDANKPAAKKRTPSAKAKGKAKAKAKSKTEDESKHQVETAPKKKMPMNAKEREEAWKALSKEEQTAKAGELVKAIEGNNLDIVTRLMKEGVKSNTRNEEGTTALYTAAKMGNIALMDFLVTNCGADVNFTNRNKETPLHAACIHDKQDAMEWLVSQGINRNAKNKKGETAANVATGETAKSEILTFKMSSKK